MSTAIRREIRDGKMRAGNDRTGKLARESSAREKEKSPEKDVGETTGTRKRLVKGNDQLAE